MYLNLGGGCLISYGYLSLYLYVFMGLSNLDSVNFEIIGRIDYNFHISLFFTSMGEAEVDVVE